MIVIMEPRASRNNIEAVINKLEEKGYKAVLNQGALVSVVAAIGDSRLVDPSSLMSLEGVADVKLVQKPYKLASRQGKAEDTVVEFSNGVKIGSKERPVTIVGPCCVESLEGLLKVAYLAKEMGCQFLRGGAFKPRTSPYDFEGLEEDALKYLAIAREKTGLLVVTEVMDTSDVPLVADYADVLQIGSRNMQNYKLLKAVGKISKPVILKRARSASIKEFLLSAEHILFNGNKNVILCERGISCVDNEYTRNTLDIAAICVIQKYSHLPVIVDPSHATGRRYLIEPMAKAALVAGASGVMIEVHDNPDCALSDGAQSLGLEQFEKAIKRINKLIGRIDYDNKHQEMFS